ncbi:MAG: chromate resistance protein ChrB domain-containing protein, partial [Candidatus Rokuibacteriota bacterium]
AAIAEIVHEADLNDGKFTRTEAVGVDLAIRALAEAIGDDDELLDRGMALMEGVYALLKRRS